MADERTLQPMIMAIVAVALLLVIGIYINATIETAVDASGTSGASINETFVTTEAGASLAVDGWRDVSCGAINGVTLAANSTVIEPGNWTQTNCVVTFTLGLPMANNSNWNVSYGYTWSAPTAASNASADSVSALSNGTPWLTIIVVIGFAVVVLGMLTSGFRKEGAQAQLTY